jgi:hypothetical protein
MDKGGGMSLEPTTSSVYERSKGCLLSPAPIYGGKKAIIATILAMV